MSWSAESGILGKRNAQVLLFALGFIFPLGKRTRSCHWLSDCCSRHEMYANQI